MIKMLSKSFPYEPKITTTTTETEEGGVAEIEQIDLTEYAMRDPLLFGDFRNAVGEFIEFAVCFIV